MPSNDASFIIVEDSSPAAVTVNASLKLTVVEPLTKFHHFPNTKFCRSQYHQTPAAARQVVALSDASSAVLPASAPSPPLRFTVDSGATDHVVSNKDLFDLNYPHQRQIKIADGSCVSAHGIGDITSSTVPVVLVLIVSKNLVRTSTLRTLVLCERSR